MKSVNKQDIINELESAVKIYGLRCLHCFVSDYNKTIFDNKIGIGIYYTLNDKQNPINTNGKDGRDYFWLQVSYETFWECWNKCKRVLKLQAFI